MTNDCPCKRCRTPLETIPDRVTATRRVYEQDGSIAAKRGTPGEVVDRDYADNWVIVEFEGQEPTICYPHEVR